MSLGTLAAVAGLDGVPALALDGQHHWAAAQAVLARGSNGAAAYEMSPGVGEDDLDGDGEPQRARPAKRGRGNGPSSQADYAQRHQAAEQRRRARINERCGFQRALCIRLGALRASAGALRALAAARSTSTQQCSERRRRVLYRVAPVRDLGMCAERAQA